MSQISFGLVKSKILYFGIKLVKPGIVCIDSAYPRSIRMQTVQTAIYCYNQNRPSQHQVAASEMDPGHVFDRQFEQRYLLGGLGPTNWRTAANGLADGPCCPANDGPNPL